MLGILLTASLIDRIPQVLIGEVDEEEERVIAGELLAHKEHWDRWIEQEQGSGGLLCFR